MGETLVKLSTDIYVYGEYKLVDGDGERRVEVISFDVGEGWFEARNGRGVQRCSMKDYGIALVLNEVTLQQGDKRMFLVRK